MTNTKQSQRASVERLALQEIADIAASGVIMRHETGHPTWSALDSIKAIVSKVGIVGRTGRE